MVLISVFVDVWGKKEIGNAWNGRVANGNPGISFQSSRFPSFTAVCFVPGAAAMELERERVVSVRCFPEWYNRPESLLRTLKEAFCYWRCRCAQFPAWLIRPLRLIIIQPVRLVRLALLAGTYHPGSTCPTMRYPYIINHLQLLHLNGHRHFELNFEKLRFYFVLMKYLKKYFTMDDLPGYAQTMCETLNNRRAALPI